MPALLYGVVKEKVFFHKRPRPDQTHVSLQDIQQLEDFIE